MLTNVDILLKKGSKKVPREISLQIIFDFIKMKNFYKNIFDFIKIKIIIKKI